jgi:hypothetical protein
MCESTQECEEREPHDGDLKQTRSPEAVGEQAGQPPAECGDQQGDGGQQTGLTFADVPGNDQAGNDEGVNHHVHAIQCPAPERGQHGIALLRRKLE